MKNFILVWKDQKQNVDISENSQTEALLKEAERFSKVKAARIRMYFMKNGTKIPIQMHQSVEIIDSKEILVVDSGPQFSFMINDLFEYIPPIFIWFAFTAICKVEFNFYMKAATYMWVFHFAKRSFEAVFVHTYSQTTLPIFSLLDNSCFKNCIYYWTFAVLISYFVCRNYSYVSQTPILQYIGIVIYIISEILNGYSHLRLRNLRPKGSLDHYLPTGFLFDQITCPNYTFEILSWIGFGIFTQHFVSFLFPLCGGVQMFYWADEKRKKLAVKYPEVMKRGRITPFSFF